MSNHIFTGSGVALITPMKSDGSVNYDVLGDLVEFHVQNGTDAIIVCVTTGEAATLSEKEHCETISFVAEKTNGRIPVIAGTGSNDTSTAVMLSKSAASTGVDALLCVTPYYNKTSQQGLVRHFNVVAVSGSDDSDAWVAWQCEHNEDMEELNTNRKYFFLPSSVSSTSVELYNAYSKSVTVNNVTIPSGESREVSYTIDKAGNVTADGKTYSLTFLKSSAESAIYVNNSNADGNGKELISYLNEDKSNYSSATGAIVDKNGKIDNTSIKKIKFAKFKKCSDIYYSKWLQGTPIQKLTVACN